VQPFLLSLGISDLCPQQYHEPTLEVDAPAAVATATPATDKSAPDRSNDAHDRVAHFLASGKAGSPGSDIAQNGEMPSPRPGHGPESTLSTSARELFEPSRPRYPRKDLLLHLIPIFMSHFRSNFFPWLEEDEIRNGAENGSLPALLANVICAVTARFSPRAELRRGPLKA